MLASRGSTPGSWLRLLHLLLVAGALSMIVGCSILPTPPTVAATTTPSPTPDAWTPLAQRPLHLPALAPGAPCPKAQGQQVNPAYGPALGDGPAYPLGFGEQGILQMYAPGSVTSQYWQQWSGARTPWIIAPASTGPILVRGGQIDGSHGMKFSGGAAPHGDYLRDPALPELKLQGGMNIDNAGWSVWLSTYTRVQVPGCYAFQVDGLNFSYTIVFQAVMS